ncbi:MAG: hypothetical protein FWG13_05610 [Leptospirales bacterium]|nr:hypothetical protein [Leptospirales bacterium]
MFKKLLITAAAVLISTTSLFAYSKGGIVLYPEAGIGISDIHDAPSGLKTDSGLYWSLGCNGGYFLDNSLALIGGLSIDHNSFEFKWDYWWMGGKYEVDLYRLMVPFGVRYHHNLLMVGGGLYLGTVILAKGEKGKSEWFDGNLDLGLFIDAGLNYQTSKTSNLLVFLRLKYDVASSSDDYDVGNYSISLNASYGFQMPTGSSSQRRR